MRIAITAVVIVITVLAGGYTLFVLANGLWDSHQPFGVIAVGVTIVGAFVVRSGLRRRRHGARYDHYDDRDEYGSRHRGRGSTGRSGSRSAGGWSSFGNSRRSGGFSSFGRSSSGRSSSGRSKSGRSSGGGSKSGGSSRGKSR